jgi:hypothetical protein
MDFDSIVSILLIIAFFILPSILKQVKAAKVRAGKNSPASSVPSRNPSIFEKISGQIRQFIQEIEQQAQQQRQAQAPEAQEDQDQANVWDLLGQDEELFEEASQVETFVPDINLEPEKNKIEKQVPKTKAQPIKTSSMSTVPGKNFVFKSNQLQNAIVWSEILSKPIALRKD